MSTVQYELKSSPDTFIDVPEEYAIKAEALVGRAIITPSDLPEAHDDPIYFGNKGIWSRANSLAKDTSSVRLQDELYLRVCINQNERNLPGLDKVTAAKLDAALIKLVEQVQS